MGKTKLDYVRKERYHDIKFNRTEIRIFSSSREREISFFTCVIRYLNYFLRECVNSWGSWGAPFISDAFANHLIIEDFSHLTSVVSSIHYNNRISLIGFCY